MSRNADLRRAGVKPVYVVAKDHTPLMPTYRRGRVNHLLKEGKAVVINANPFTIRLKFDSKKFTQDLYAGIDTGRENIGSAVSNDDGENVYLADTRSNNRSIKKNMQERAGYRRERRRHDRQSKQRKAKHDDTELKNGDDDVCRSKHECKSVKISYPGAEKPVTHKVIKGKEGKFNNRKRSEGWITPSARQLIQITMAEVKQMCEIMPITHLSIERVCFDFHKMDDATVYGWKYQKGPLYGYKSYKDYIWDQQDGKCALCGKPIEEYHHIIPRSQKGSNQVKNIIGLCKHCHDSVHNDEETQKYLFKLKEGSYVQHEVSLLNSVMPALIDELSVFCAEHGIELIVTDGHTTNDTRDKYGLMKDHSSDAYAISLAGRTPAHVMYAPVIYQKRRFKKKSGGMIAKRNQREYQANEKTVAWNRHKAENQKKPSLEEYIAEYRKTHTAGEADAHFRSLTVKPAKRTYTYHKYGIVSPVHTGDIVRYTKHNKIKGNTKVNTVVATSIELSQAADEPHMYYSNDDKNYKMKFCHTIEGGCLHTVSTSETMKYLLETEAEYQKQKAKKKKSKTANKPVHEELVPQSQAFTFS